MTTLLIDYHVDDYPGWKAIFDRDPLGREAHGVTAHHLYRDSEDAHHLMLSLEFRSDREAAAFRHLMQPVWEISGAGRAWLLHNVEEHQDSARSPQRAAHTR